MTLSVDGLRAWGWDESWECAFDALDLTDVEPARVTAQHRDRWTLQRSGGVETARSAVRPRPVTGDWVAIRPGREPTDPPEIVGVLPRRSTIRRGSAGGSGEEQVLAANVDRLWIVQALDTPPNLRSLERYLAVGWESGATPEIVLTKSDLAEDLAGAVASVKTIAFGVSIRAVSIEDAASLDILEKSLVPSTTVALLGPSGAGKSTLVNRLARADLAATGEVRSGDRKGRHTTTGRQLFRLPGGVLLLDTPGMRELRVLDLEEGLRNTFPDVDELARACRFRDCVHESEPGCAVQAAVDRGDLPRSRLESFEKLRAETAFERRKTDPRARAAHVAEHKTALKTLKAHPKRKGCGG